ncbi:MAG: C-GCAxxG-C-C family protein [Clostridiales Family XIII bacterium]|jgi:hypothetical protein|nr:C-GCAxxG-C-C family protein [Clostridiales Family XIII bacterium]
MNIDERIFECKLKSYCCSQTIVSLCLEDMGKQNEDLVNAMAAFCGGMGRGKICGTLAAAIAILHVKDQETAKAEWQDEYMDWFEDRFGGYDCYEIIQDDPIKRIEFCPKLVLESYLKLREYILGEADAFSDGAGER